MKKGVTKKELIKSLETTLKLTRNDVYGLELLDEDTVIVIYEDGSTRRVNITLDSGLAIIRDVARALD